MRRYYDPALISQKELSDAIDEINTRYGAPKNKSRRPMPDDLQPLKSGRIVATDYVVDSEEAVQYLVEKIQNDELDIYKQLNSSSYNPDTLDFSPPSAVDMESAGFLHAVQMHNRYRTPVTPIIVRGISDVCAKKDDSAQDIAARNAIIGALCFAELFHRADEGK